jgi:hypothetical protein
MAEKKKKRSLDEEDLFPDEKGGEEEEEPVQQPLPPVVIEVIQESPKKEKEHGAGPLVEVERETDEGIRKEAGVYVSVGTDFYRGGDRRENHDPGKRTFTSGDRRYVCMPDKDATIKEALDAALSTLPPSERTSLERLSRDANVEIRSGGKKVHLEDRLSEFAGVKITADGTVEYKQVDLLLTKEDQGGYLK